MSKNKQSGSKPTVFFDRKRFAADPKRKYGTALFVLSDDGRIIPSEISAAKYQIRKDRTKDGLLYAEIDQRITKAWKVSDMYRKYLDVSEYRKVLQEQPTQGIVQTELNWVDFTVCDPKHDSQEYNDFKTCRDCKLSRCLNCNSDMRGEVSAIANHFGVRGRDIVYLVQQPHPSNYNGSVPVCRRNK